MSVLRIATLNAGLLPGIGRWIAVPYIEERAPAIGMRLEQHQPDIVALQEVYSARHRDSIAASLARSCPHAAYNRTSRPLDSGLMVLARERMRSRFEAFHTHPLDEYLAARGFQVVTIDHLNVTLFNVHATAGGLFCHPESARMERIRERQLVQLSDRALDAPGIAVIVGDLNAGPEASPANFRRLLTAGWYDCAAELDGPTWDPANNLNVDGPHRTSPPQRIDHVLVRVSDVTSGRVLPGVARRVLREADVPTSGGRVTPSDHCGLLVELELRS